MARLLTRSVVAAGALLTLAGAALLAGSPARAATASLTVAAVDNVTGVDVGPTCATAYGFDPQTGGNGDFAQACSSTGVVVLDNLTAGQTYQVRVSPAYPSLYLPGSPKDPATGAEAYPSAPGTVAVPLAKGARISGSVTAADGTPLDGSVTTYAPDGSYGDSGNVFSGRYAFVTRPGTWNVSFQTGQQTSWAVGARAQKDAATYTLTAGDEITVDQVVPVATTVSGRLTDAATGAGLAGLCVDVVNPTAGFSFGSGCSDATGAYQTSGDIPTGTWTAEVRDPSGTYVPASRPITVTAGISLTGVDFALTVGGTLTGRVVDAATGAALPNACVQAFVGRTTTGVGVGGNPDTGCSDATGRWTLRGLPSGPVTVFVNGDATHQGRWAKDATTQAKATLFTAVAGQQVKVGTVELHLGAVLSGRVTDRAGNPVAGATVAVADPKDAPLGPAQVSTTTGPDGRYVLANIPAQTQSVRVEAPYSSGLAWQWSGGAASPDTAKQLTFALDKKYTQSFALPPQATLTVLPSGGTWGKNVWLYVQTPTGSYVSQHGEALTGSGPLVLPNLPAGTVVVQNAPISIVDTASWYDGATTLAAAKRITLTEGKNTTITLTP